MGKEEQIQAFSLSKTVSPAVVPSAPLLIPYLIMGENPCQCQENLDSYRHCSHLSSEISCL